MMMNSFNFGSKDEVESEKVDKNDKDDKISESSSQKDLNFMLDKIYTNLIVNNSNIYPMN